MEETYKEFSFKFGMVGWSMHADTCLHICRSQGTKLLRIVSDSLLFLGFSAPYDLSALQISFQGRLRAGLMP